MLDSFRSFFFYLASRERRVVTLKDCVTSVIMMIIWIFHISKLWKEASSLVSRVFNVSRTISGL